MENKGPLNNWYVCTVQDIIKSLMSHEEKLQYNLYIEKEKCYEKYIIESNMFEKYWCWCVKE